MRRFVVIGARANVSADFVLADIPGTTGRLDVLLRCVRAALLVSHGVRRDVVVYLVLLGDAPRSLRIDGSTVQYLRPDERSLATLVHKSLSVPIEGSGFAAVRPGIAAAYGGIDVVLDDLGAGALYVLDERGDDVRAATLDGETPVYFVGDPLGIDEAVRTRIDARGAQALSVGPTSIHAEDAVTVITNECDRRAAG